MSMNNIALSMRCDLPTNKGAYSTDVLVFCESGDAWMLVATDMSDMLTFRWPVDAQDPDPISDDEMSNDKIVRLLRWANDSIKCPFIRSRCEMRGMVPIGEDGALADASALRDLVLSLSAIDQIHPSPLKPETASVTRARARRRGGDDPGRSGDVVLDYCHDGTKCVTVAAWKVPYESLMSKTIPDAMWLPYPRVTDARTSMNATIVTLGGIVRDGDGESTYVPSAAADASPVRDLMGSAIIGEQSITFVRVCDDASATRHRNGICMSTIDRSISTSLCSLFSNGVEVRDETSLGLVSVVNYAGLHMVMMCGMPVIDRVRFERAHIPFVLPHENDREVRVLFRDDAAELGIVRVYYDGAPRGVMDVRKKKKRKCEGGEISFLEMVKQQ